MLPGLFNNLLSHFISWIKASMQDILLNFHTWNMYEFFFFFSQKVYISCRTFEWQSEVDYTRNLSSSRKHSNVKASTDGNNQMHLSSSNRRLGRSRSHKDQSLSHDGYSVRSLSLVYVLFSIVLLTLLWWLLYIGSFSGIFQWAFLVNLDLFFPLLWLYFKLSFVKFIMSNWNSNYGLTLRSVRVNLLSSLMMNRRTLILGEMELRR